MALQGDFSLVQYEDGVLYVNLNPPVPIGGWNIQLSVMNHFGSISGRIVKSVSSGLNGTSGITVTNSGNGQFKAQIVSVNTSGLEYGNYAFAVNRLDSGCRATLVEGYFTVNPGTGV